MNAFKNLGKIILTIALFTGLWACEKDDGGEPFEVVGDVFVIKRTIDNEVKYANSYAAWGNQPMSVAKVSTPQGAEITLTPTSDNNYTWAKEPPLSNFITSAPAEANYQFLVVNEDISHQATDLLEFDDIDFTTITSTDFVGEDLSVRWETNAHAESYVIQLYKPSGEIAFLSYTLPEQMTRLDIGASTASGTWYETPESGNQYTVELHSLRFEDDAVSEEYKFQIQEISVSEADIVWQ